MKLFFYEDDGVEQLNPIALLRPAFDLRCGIRGLRERMLDHFQSSDWGCLVRPCLVDSLQEQHPDAFINQVITSAKDDVLIVNSRLLVDPRQLGQLNTQNILRNGNEIAAVLLDAADWNSLADQEIESFPQRFSQLTESRNPIPIECKLVRYPWDLVSSNSCMLQIDFEMMQQKDCGSFCPSKLNVVGEHDRLLIHPEAIIEPQVVLNCEHGPIMIGQGAKIEAFSRIEGPCYIGEQTHIFQAKIRGGTTIGPVSRIGGEVEACIFQGYSNKYHDGFLGHSFVGQWVNLGALTTNSDLKNDYSTVKVPVGTNYIDSGEMKVGTFFGDHSKTAIGSMFNTGTSVGVMSMILPAGRLCPKQIPSFSRYWNGQLDDEVNLEKCFQTAHAAMARRGMTFSLSDRALLQQAYHDTTEERSQAINRQ